MKRFVLLTIVVLGFTSLISAQWQTINPPPSPPFSEWEYGHRDVASHNWIYWVKNWDEGSLYKYIKMYSSSDNSNSWDSLHYWSGVSIYTRKIEFISEDTGYFIYDILNTKSRLYQTMNNFNPFNYNPVYCQEIFTYRHSVMLNYNDLYLIDSEARIFHLENDTIQLIYELPIVLADHEHPKISATQNHHLYVACKSYPNNTYENDLILSSYDGGYSWDTSFISTTIDINNLKFASDSLGFAIGANGVILRTKDAGQTWENMSSGTDNNLISLDFMNEETWMVGGMYATLLITKDQGETWTAIEAPCTQLNCHVNYIKFPEKDDIVYINAWGLKWASIDSLSKITKHETVSKHFKIYPNPASNNFTIEIINANSDDAQIDFFNLIGNKICSVSKPKNENIFDCSNFETGIYIVRLTIEGKQSTQKLVIQ